VAIVLKDGSLKLLEPSGPVKNKVPPCTGTDALYRPYGSKGSRGIALLFLVQALMFCTGRTAHRGSRGIALLFLVQALMLCTGRTAQRGVEV